MGVGSVSGEYIQFNGAVSELSLKYVKGNSEASCNVPGSISGARQDSCQKNDFCVFHSRRKIFAFLKFRSWSSK